MSIFRYQHESVVANKSSYSGSSLSGLDELEGSSVALCRGTFQWNIFMAEGLFYDIEGTEDALNVHWCLHHCVSEGTTSTCRAWIKLLSNFKLEKLEAYVQSSQTCQTLLFAHQNHIPWTG